MGRKIKKREMFASHEDTAKGLHPATPSQPDKRYIVTMGDVDKRLAGEDTAITRIVDAVFKKPLTGKR